MAFNSEQVKNSLNLLTQILNQHHIEHRFFGSIIPTAINGSLHRSIADLDLLADFDKKDILIKALKKSGYKKNPAKSLGVASEWLKLYQFKHPKLLDIGFFAVNFGKIQTTLDLPPLKLTIENRSIKKTTYSLYDIDFIGIPQDTAYTGILISKRNPKRIEEFKIFKQNNITPRPNNYLNVYLGTINITLTLSLIQFLLNIIGIIRIKLGLPFDPWRYIHTNSN
jgi:hypothetical protein